VRAAAFSTTLADRGMFCDLLAQAPLNLERNVSLEAVRAFKLVTHTEVDAIIEVIRQLMPGLTQRDGIDIVATRPRCPAHSGKWPTRHQKWRRFTAATRAWRTQSSRSNRAYAGYSPRCSKECWVSECLRPYLDRQGGTAAAKGTTGTVDLAEEDHDVVWVRSCRL
jgi:hypothetical protein